MQINADWNAQPFVYYNETSIKSLNNLLGFDTKQNQIALQFGDLFEPIDKLSRHSTSGQIPSEIAKLCAMIVTVSKYLLKPYIFLGTFSSSKNLWRSIRYWYHFTLTSSPVWILVQNIWCEGFSWLNGSSSQSFNLTALCCWSFIPIFIYWWIASADWCEELFNSKNHVYSVAYSPLWITLWGLLFPHSDTPF